MGYNPLKHNRQSIRLKGYDYTRAGVYFVTICTHQSRHLFGEIHDGVMHQNPLGRIVLSRWYALPRFFPRLRLDAFVVMPNHVHGVMVLNPPRTGRGNASAGDDGIFDIDRVGTGSGVIFTPRAGRGDASAGVDQTPEIDRVGPESDVILTPRAGRGDASIGIDQTLNIERVLQDSSNIIIPRDASPLPAPHRPNGTARGSIGAIVQNFKSTATRGINRRRKTPGDLVWQRNYYDRILWDDRALERVRRYIEMNPIRWDEDRLNSKGAFQFS